MPLKRQTEKQTLILFAAIATLLQSCSYTSYSYRVQPGESYHEDCDYAFTCVMFSEPSYENGPSLLVTIGMASNSKSKNLALNNSDFCKSASDVESVSLGFAETNETFELLKSANRYEYRFRASLMNDGFKQRKKLVLKIYFKRETAPRIFFLKQHAEQTPRALFGSC